MFIRNRYLLFAGILLITAAALFAFITAITPLVATLREDACSKLPAALGWLSVIWHVPRRA